MRDVGTEREGSILLDGDWFSSTTSDAFPSVDTIVREMVHELSTKHKQALIIVNLMDCSVLHFGQAEQAHLDKGSSETVRMGSVPQ